MIRGNVEHLSQDELLLLADGDLADERAAHAEACPHCSAAAGAALGRLTAVTAQLRATAPQDSPESHSASWVRLRNAIRGESGSVAAHLSSEELVLQLDEELAPERALHLESCEACHDELLRVQALLFDIEHELRALMPAEPRERRLAAAAALEKKLYPPKKVISFPVRWGAVYAVAAALTFAVFGGLWNAQHQIDPPEQPAIAVQTPAPAQPIAPVAAPAPVPVRTEPAPEISSAPAVAVALEQTPAEPEQLAPAERFTIALAPALAPPSRAALTPSPLTPSMEPRVSPQQPSRLALTLETPRVPRPNLPAAASASAPESSEPADPALLLAGLDAAARSGAWMADISPELRNGRLTFTGKVSSPSRRDELIAALGRELAGDGASFDIVVAPAAAAFETAEASRNLGDRPVGGMMRTALLEHYGDAARRSFQQPAPSALEAEIARFAGEVYRSQSKLVRHAHALNGLVEQFDVESLTPEATRTFDALVRFHAEGVAEGETRIYDFLSESLPRRFWNHRGDRQAPADSDAAASAHAILADALRLDETLTTLLGSASGSVDVNEVETSAGALLYRIRTRARNLTSGLDSAH